MLWNLDARDFFDGLRIPIENRIGEEGHGFKYILSGMNAERILIASECIGDARLTATNVFVREDGRWRMVHHMAGATS